MDSLHAYTLKIVELGQRTLALQRQGQGLPEELATLAAELLVLEAELRQAPVVSPAEARANDRDSAVLPASPPTLDDILVVDMEEEAGNAPAFIYEPPDALPPLVINVPLASGVDVAADPVSANAEPPVMPGTSPLGEDGHFAAELRTCARCGATLRPGKRFCHRCGAPA